MAGERCYILRRPLLWVPTYQTFLVTSLGQLQPHWISMRRAPASLNLSGSFSGKRDNTRPAVKVHLRR